MLCSRDERKPLSGLLPTVRVVTAHQFPHPASRRRQNMLKIMREILGTLFRNRLSAETWNQSKSMNCLTYIKMTLPTFHDAWWAVLSFFPSHLPCLWPKNCKPTILDTASFFMGSFLYLLSFISYLTLQNRPLQDFWICELPTERIPSCQEADGLTDGWTSWPGCKLWKPINKVSVERNTCNKVEQGDSWR